MKKLITTIRTWLVITYANHQYKKNVLIADRYNHLHHARFYVALHPNGKQLFVLSRKGFRNIKKELLPANRDTILNLKQGSFYYTGNAIGADTMPPLEKEARRFAFIKLILNKAKKRR